MTTLESNGADNSSEPQFSVYASESCRFPQRHPLTPTSVNGGFRISATLMGFLLIGSGIYGSNSAIAANLNHFGAGRAGPGLVVLDHSKVLEEGEWAARATYSLAHQPLACTSPDKLRSVSVQNLHIGGAAFAWSPAPLLELAVGVPLILIDARFGAENRACGAGHDGLSGEQFGLNDPEFRARWEAFSAGVLTTSLRAAVRLPVSSAIANQEIAPLFGDPFGSGQLGATAGLGFDKVALILDIGVELRPAPGSIPAGRYSDIKVGDAFVFGAGVLAELPWGFGVSAEIIGRITEIAAPGDFREPQVPLEALVGLRYEFGAADVKLAAGGGLSDGYGTPAQRIATSVGVHGEGLYPFEWLRRLRWIQDPLEDAVGRARATRVPVEPPAERPAEEPSSECPEPGSSEAEFVVIPGCPSADKPVFDEPDEGSMGDSLTAREVIVVLHLFFKHDRAELEPVEVARLRRELGARPPGGELVAVSVHAHADTTGGTPYNDALAARRAQSVVRTLEWEGIPRAIINATASGAHDALLPDTHSANRRARVEIHYRIPVEQQETE